MQVVERAKEKDADYFQEITEDATRVIVRALYSTDKKLNGILEGKGEDQTHRIMLSNIRSMGWIVAQSGNFLVLIKGEDRRRYYYGITKLSGNSVREIRKSDPV